MKFLSFLMMMFLLQNSILNSVSISAPLNQFEKIEKEKKDIDIESNSIDDRILENLDCNFNNESSDEDKQRKKEKLDKYFIQLQYEKNKEIIEKDIKKISFSLINQIQIEEEKFEDREDNNIQKNVTLQNFNIQEFKKNRLSACDEIKMIMAMAIAGHENENFFVGSWNDFDCNNDEINKLDNLLNKPMLSVAVGLAALFVAESAAAGLVATAAGPVAVVLMSGLTAKIIFEQFKKYQENKKNNNKDSKDPKNFKDPKDPKDPKKSEQYTYKNGKIDDYDKHHENSYEGIGKAPRDPQEALDKSVSVKNSTQRVSTQDNKIVILKESAKGLYHAYIIENYNSLAPSVRQALFENGFIRTIKSGKIIK